MLIEGSGTNRLLLSIVCNGYESFVSSAMFCQDLIDSKGERICWSGRCRALVTRGTEW